MKASAWTGRLRTMVPDTRNALSTVYGTEPDVLAGRVRLLRDVLERFCERFGDREVRLFRSPGRVNLRGMHVDTHGGYLNLMTHQRETVAAISPAEGDRVEFSNVDRVFDDVEFSTSEQSTHPAFANSWLDFISHPDVQGAVRSRKGHWGNYLRGCLLSLMHSCPEARVGGMIGVVGSDLPRGAALSSSGALCTAVMKGMAALTGVSLGPEEFILAERGAEWYAGARIGVSDQGAMVLGGRGELVNVALMADDLDTSGAKRVPFPEDLCVLVVDSHTERSLSGMQLVEYTRNRLAYSMAMEVFRQETSRQGCPHAAVSRMDRLARLSPGALHEWGGADLVWRVLAMVPEQATLAELAQLYSLPNMGAAYDEYFGHVPAELRPSVIRLRGPLLFGIAESERARVFAGALESGDYVRAGALMTIGHDGDRRVRADGAPYEYDVSDRAMARLRDEGAAIEMCPGCYGASTPALDVLVDAALEGGALGACLTGAGLAGAILVLCRRDDAPGVKRALEARLATAEYAALTGRPKPLTDEQVGNAVVENHATAAAGEIVLGG